MSFALYGESQSYVFLATETTREKTVNSFLADIEGCGVSIGEVFNIFAVEGRNEDKDTEDFIFGLIAEANANK